MPTTTLIRKISALDPETREVVLLILEEIERQREQLSQQVTKTEFNELKVIVADLARKVAELAEAQKRTEERLTRLEETVAALAEAQKRTEERLTRLEEAVAALAEAQKRTEERVNELAEAQKRTEERLTRLEETVAALAEAQKRTEERLNQLAEAQKRTEERLTRLEETVAALAEAQKRTEERLNQLAEAQKRTEEALRKLAEDHRVTRERVEGLSNTVGYTLEDRAFRSLPALLREHGITVHDRLVRKYVVVRGKERQVNIYGHGERDGKPVLIVGEAKVRPSRKEIDRFIRLARQLAEQEGKEAVMLFVAYDFPPKIEKYAKERGVIPIWSYELAL